MDKEGANTITHTDTCIHAHKINWSEISVLTLIKLTFIVQLDTL